MKEGLSYFTDTHLTSFGLIIFFGFFLCVILWTSKSKTRQLCDYAKTLPFNDGDTYEQQN